MTELPTVPPSELVFNPDQEFSKEELTHRRKIFSQEMMELAVRKGDPALQGYEAAKAFIRYIEPNIHNKEIDFSEIIEEFDTLMRKAQAIFDARKRPGEDVECWTALSAGWKTELAAARYFYDSGCDVDLATPQQDLYELTDLVATDKDGEGYRVQAKSFPLCLTHDQLAEREMNIPILNPLGTIDDLNLFLDNIQQLTTDKAISIGLPSYPFTLPITMQQLSLIRKVGLSGLEIKAEPAPGLFKPSRLAQKRNRLVSLIYDAFKMYAFSDRYPETPVLMLLGSPHSQNSDIEPTTCELRATSKNKANQEMNEIISRSKANAESGVA